MRLTVAGQDRTGTLGAELEGAARRLHDSALERALAREAPVLALRDCSSEDEFLLRHENLLRFRNTTDTRDFVAPAGRGRAARMVHRVRLAVWRLLRYQHDWTAFRQNAVNRQLHWAVEFERMARLKQAARFERRLAELEARPKPEPGSRP